MSELSIKPEGSTVGGNSCPHTYVPVERMPEHPLLRFATVVGGELVWPTADGGQRRCVQDIRVVLRDGKQRISIPPRINFDLFVDEDTAQFGRVSLYEDFQRYYTRFSDTQMLHVGTYTAITIDGERRYFAWRSNDWHELDIDLFTYHRDADGVFFGETSPDDLARLSPGALERQPGSRSTDATREQT